MEQVWYLANEGTPDGPFSIRDLDVKFRTQELASGTFAWKEGMAEWKPLFEIEQIKRVLQESTDEVNDPQVRKNMPKKDNDDGSD